MSLASMQPDISNVVTLTALFEPPCQPALASWFGAGRRSPGASVQSQASQGGLHFHRSSLGDESAPPHGADSWSFGEALQTATRSNAHVAVKNAGHCSGEVGGLLPVSSWALFLIAPCQSMDNGRNPPALRSSTGQLRIRPAFIPIQYVRPKGGMRGWTMCDARHTIGPPGASWRVVPHSIEGACDGWW